MSHKEARRPGLVQAALAGKVTNREAAHALGLSVRHFRRLKAAYRRAGVQGLLHGNRSRPSPRQLAAPERQRIVALIEGRYAGLNDCHLTEKLRELEDVAVCRETVRQIRVALKRPAVHRRRPPRHRARRLREAHVGSWVLLDGSTFAWLGEDHPMLTLLGAVDDATGQILVLHFRPHEDLHGYTTLLRRLCEGHGLPINLFGDRLSVFVRNDDHWSIDEQLAGVQRPTQFGQMLVELGVGYLRAHSPEAKGRIERLWRTLQDRLVQELRLRGLRTVEEAEAFLPEFIADYNRRFARAPRQTPSAWRRPPRDLDRVLACRYSRVVARDNTVTLPGRWIQLSPGPGGRSWHRCRVEARELLDGRLLILRDGQLLAEHPSPSPNFILAPRAHVARRQALGIDGPRSPRIVDRSTPKTPTRVRNPRRGQLTDVRPPAPNHPWKRSYKPQPLPSAAGTGGT